MNINELRNILLTKGIPSDLYNLDATGRKDERYCIETNGDEWVVFFTERGTKTTEVKFSTEDAACRYLLDNLII